MEIASFDDGYRPKMPKEFRDALDSNKKALKVWEEITPIARRDWLLWMINGKKKETLNKRVETAVDMLSKGKKRVCCFGGYNWLKKVH